MSRVSLYLLYRQVCGESGGCRRRDIPHAELSLGEIRQTRGQESRPELDTDELRDSHQREDQVARAPPITHSYHYNSDLEGAQSQSATSSSWVRSTPPSTGLSSMEFLIEPSASDETRTPQSVTGTLRKFPVLASHLYQLDPSGVISSLTTPDTTSTPAGRPAWPRWCGSCLTAGLRAAGTGT